MDESPRKRQKLDNDYCWHDGVDLNQDLLSSFDESANQFYNANQINNRQNDGNLSTNAVNARNTIRNQINSSSLSTNIVQGSVTSVNLVSSNVVPSSLVQENVIVSMVIPETPTELDLMREKILIVENELRVAKQKIEQLNKEIDAATGETKVVKDKYNDLEKSYTNEILARKDRAKGVNEAEVKQLREKIKQLEPQLDFKNQEFLQLQMKCRQLEKQSSSRTVVTVDAMVQCDIGDHGDEVEVRSEFRISRGTMTPTEIYPHLLSITDSPPSQHHPQNRRNARTIFKIVEGREIKPPTSGDDGVAMDTDETRKTRRRTRFKSSLSSNSSRPDESFDPTTLKYKIIETFLCLGNDSLDDGFEQILPFLEKQFNSNMEKLQKDFLTKVMKPPSKTPSDESLFSSMSVMNLGRSLTQRRFHAQEEERLMILSFICKIIKTNVKLMGKLVIEAPEAQKNPEIPKTSETSESVNKDADSAKSPKEANDLITKLLKLLNLHNLCGKRFTLRLQRQMVCRIFHLFSAMIEMEIKPKALKSFVDEGRVIEFLDLSKGIEVVTCALDFIGLCVMSCENVQWLCKKTATEKKLCYISGIQSLVKASVESRVIGDDSGIAVLDKVIDLLACLFRHAGGVAVLAAVPNECSCSCEVLNQLIVAICQATEKCMTNVDEFQFKVLSKGIDFLHVFLSVDKYFIHKRELKGEIYVRLLRNMDLVYGKSGRTVTDVEDTLLRDLDDDMVLNNNSLSLPINNEDL